MTSFLFWLAGILMLILPSLPKDIPLLGAIAYYSFFILISFIPYIIHVLMYIKEKVKGKFGTFGFWNIRKQYDFNKLFSLEAFPGSIFEENEDRGTTFFSWHADVFTVNNKEYLLDPISYVYMVILGGFLWLKLRKTSRGNLTLKQYIFK